MPGIRQENVHTFLLEVNVTSSGASSLSLSSWDAGWDAGSSFLDRLVDTMVNAIIVITKMQNYT